MSNDTSTTLVSRTEESSVADDGRNNPGERRGKRFIVNIEGTEHPWDKDTITTEQIIALGGWDPSLGVIEIDKDNNERTLQPGEVIDLKPGHGFSKRIRWKRG
jgi:hypothetical protein